MNGLVKPVVVLTLYLLFNLQAGGQKVQRHIAVRAYLYNIAKNIEWPDENVINEFNFLVLGNDENIINELKNLSKSRTLRNKPIRIIASKVLPDSLANIQLIFITAGFFRETASIIDYIQNKNILLVTDGYPDKNLVMINFYDTKEGNLLFEINRANIINQHLKILPDIVFAGGTEIDVAELYREGQKSLYNLQKHINNLESELKNLEQTIITKTREANAIKDSLYTQSQKMHEQEKALKIQASVLDQKKAEKENQIKRIDEQQKILNEQKRMIEQQKNELITGNEMLRNQKTEIERQKSQIQSQYVILKEQNIKIHSQRRLVYLLVTVTVLVSLLGFNIFNAYRMKRKQNALLEKKVANRTHSLKVLNEKLEKELAERKKAEEEIKQLNITLEDRVNERTRQLEMINKELESFSYSISHDLRAPLRAISGFSQILARRHRESLNEEGRQYMDYVVEASNRMDQLIKDLLNYSRLGRKAIDLRPIPLCKIMDNMLTDFHQRLSDIGARIEIEKDLPDVIGDESLLRQIFTNLLENAINYRRPEVQLEIKVFCEQNHDKCIVKFSDNGIGIPK